MSDSLGRSIHAKRPKPIHDSKNDLIFQSRSTLKGRKKTANGLTLMNEINKFSSFFLSFWIKGVPTVWPLGKRYFKKLLMFAPVSSLYPFLVSNLGLPLPTSLLSWDVKFSSQIFSFLSETSNHVLTRSGFRNLPQEQYTSKQKPPF